MAASTVRHWPERVGSDSKLFFVEREEWHLDGVLHREGGPARREWTVTPDDHVVLTMECWLQRGGLHRDDGPALRRWHWAGRTYLCEEQWWKNDELHRACGGPAHSMWALSADGDHVLEQAFWFDNGELHREDSPAWWRHVHHWAGPLQAWYHHGEPVDAPE